MPHRSAKGNAIYILPNLLTTCCLFSGFYSIIHSINGNFFNAAVAILIAAVFDGLDGRVARLTGTTSKFGMEYDSLSDLVAFGVAPGLLAYLWVLQPYGRYGWLAAFCMWLPRLCDWPDLTPLLRKALMRDRRKLFRDCLVRLPP